MSYPASAIAYAFVKKGISEGLFVTQMKLQKMVYFAHGYHLARYGKPLISESFEAWRFGPVVPSIYQDYKLYGSTPITDTFYLDQKPEDTELDERAKEAINYTWEVTQGLSATALSNWTHQPRSPWSKVYNPADWANLIDNSTIKEYFEELLTTQNS